jgi:hypothetical protein
MLWMPFRENRSPLVVHSFERVEVVLCYIKPDDLPAVWNIQSVDQRAGVDKQKLRPHIHAVKYRDLSAPTMSSFIVCG